MRKINKLLAICLFLGTTTITFAQNEAQYTQYMYNTSQFNPAYAGSRGVTSFYGMHRSQWFGIPEAPKTSLISFHKPLENNNLGIGATLFHESIGPEAKNIIVGDVSYTVNFENSKLAFGLKGSLGLYDVDPSRLKGSKYDPLTPMIAQNLFVPNFGAGVYWYSENYYVGFSVPNLLETKAYSFNKKEEKISVVKNTQHYHLMAGYVFDLTRDIKFKPAVLSKIVKGSPLLVDLSANFMFNERFILGAAWRWSAAVSGMAGFQINKNWFIGYAYDYDTTELSQFSLGSHEIFLRYELFNKVRKIMSPRFF